MSKKLLFLAVLILLIGGVFFVWQKKSGIVDQLKTEDPQTIQAEKPLSEKEKAEKYARNWDGNTSDWKVYMNDSLGFALRYPEEIFDFRVLPVSDGVGVYSKPLPPKEFRIALTQKGYSEDDYTHQIWMNLNSLKSEKEYYSESKKDTVIKLVSFGSKTGKMYGTKETTQKLEHDYEAFLKEGACSPDTFTVVFDDIKNPNGDFRSYIHVGCEGNDGNDMGRIYRAIYQSIRFF